MNIIFTMCFTGSILFLLYLIAVRIFKNSLSNRWKYIILKLVLFFFLTPLGFLKLILHQAPTQTDFKLAGNIPIMVSTPHSTYTNSAYQINLTIVLIWIVMAIAAFVWQQLKYFRFKKLIQLSMTEITDLDIIDYVDHYRQTVRIKRKVRLYQSNCISPFTAGILSPLIVLPANLSSEKQRLILKHELTHIRRCDTLFLFLRHLVTCIYWFNPLVYLLELQLNKTVEASCDEIVTLGMNQKDRKNYASLILDMAANDVQYRTTCASSFSNSTNGLKERMDLIMIPDKQKKHGKRLSVLLASCMVLCSSFTAFAYQSPTELDMVCNSSNNPLLNIRSSDTIVFQSGDFKLTNSSSPILYDYQFTDTDGNIYKIDTSDRSEYAACNHDYVEGTISKHSKKSNGGCITKYYDAQRCSKCGKIILGSLIDTETHEVCPH